MQKRFTDMLFVVAAIIVATLILEAIKARKAKKGNGLVSGASAEKLAQGATAEGAANV